jgi:hypothetical protein
MSRTFKLLVLLFLAACSPKPQSSENAQDVIRLIDEQNYQFVMEFVRPTGGRQRVITGNYTLRVSKDEVVADLPYIGRAYQAPIGTDGGIRFKSKDFSYDVAVGKEDRRLITIKPRDVSDVQELMLTVFPGGRSDLRITSNNRQPISYSGQTKAL